MYVLIWRKGSKVVYHPLQTLSFPDGSNGKDPACNVGNLSSIPGLGKSPEEEHGTPYSSEFLKGKARVIITTLACYKKSYNNNKLNKIKQHTIIGKARNRSQFFASWISSLFNFMRFLIQFNKNIFSTFTCAHHLLLCKIIWIRLDLKQLEIEVNKI